VGKSWLGVVVVLVGTALSVVFAAPAVAHSCAQPVHIPPDRATQVPIGVTVGDVPVHDVKVQFANSVQVTQVVQQRGWTVEQLDPTTVHFSGGTLDPNTCATFPIVVRSSVAGTFAVRAFETQADGSLVEHPAEGDIFAQPDGSTVVVRHGGPPNPLFEQVVYVDAKNTGVSTGGIVLAAVALPALAALGYIVFGRRRRVAPSRAVAPRTGPRR
jgi:LPXTG-motif cell wall-anchored protein